MSERHVPDNQKTASSYISSGIGRSCLPKMSCIFPQNDRHILGVLIQFERETWERDLRASGVRKTLHAVTTTGQWRSTCLIASDFSLPSSSQISYQPRIGQLIYAWEWPFFFGFSGEQHFLLPSHRWLLECSSCDRCFCCWTTQCDLFGKGRSWKCRWLLPLPPLTASWVPAPVFSVSTSTPTEKEIVGNDLSGHVGSPL